MKELVNQTMESQFIEMARDPSNFKEVSVNHFPELNQCLGRPVRNHEFIPFPEKLRLNVITYKQLFPLSDIPAREHGAFSAFTLEHLCDYPHHCDGDEYLVVNGKLWQLPVLLNHGWKYSDLKTLPRLLMKGDKQDA